MKISAIKLNLYHNRLNKIYIETEMMGKYDTKYIISDKTVEYNGEIKSLYDVIMDNSPIKYAVVESLKLDEKTYETALNIIVLLTGIVAFDFTRRYHDIGDMTIEECLNQVTEFVREMLTEIINDCKPINTLKAEVKTKLRNSIVSCGL